MRKEDAFCMLTFGIIKEILSTCLSSAQLSQLSLWVRKAAPLLHKATPWAVQAATPPTVFVVAFYRSIGGGRPAALLNELERGPPGPPPRHKWNGIEPIEPQRANFQSVGANRAPLTHWYLAIQMLQWCFHFPINLPKGCQVDCVTPPSLRKLLRALLCC